MKRSIGSPSRTDTPQPSKKSKLDNAPSADGWTKVEKRKRKKANKIQAKQDNLHPRFLYSNSEILKRQNPIGIDEIRDLVLHIVADVPPPNWCRVDNAQLIEKVLVLLVPGVTPEILSLALPTSSITNPNVPLSIPLVPSSVSSPRPLSVPFIASTFSHACPTRAPGDATRMHSVYSSFFNGPVSNQERQRRATMRALADRTRNRGPEQYLMTLEQMVDNDYPIPSYMADVFQKPDSSWIETPQVATSLLSEPKPDQPKRKVYAIDCEMCVTEDGKELTRVCMIDFHTGRVVYDQLVKPKKPIVDYLTRWSGITPEALAPVTTTLSEVQEHVLKMLSPPVPNPFSTKPSSPASVTFQTPILIGHSLESDLRALKLCHPCCIDTALIYHHPRGRPLKPGLAWLTKKWCNREIQNRGESGHDPEEDARACLDLVKKKIEEGPEFGEFKIDFESIFERMGKATKKGGVGVVRSAVVDHGNPNVIHGSRATTCVCCTSDEEVVNGVLGALPGHHFVFGRLIELATVRGWITQKDKDKDPSAPPPPPLPDPSTEDLATNLSKIHENLKTIHSSLPSRTALIIFTGHSDPRKMSVLAQRKNAFEGALRRGKKFEDLDQGEKWSSSDARELEEHVALARQGLLFLGVKN